MFPEIEQPRCWHHTIVNVLDRLPKRQQVEARGRLCAIPDAETRHEAEKTRDDFIERFGTAYPDAAKMLRAD